MDLSQVSQFKDLGVSVIAVLCVSYILYQVIINLRQEHAKNQEWFQTFVNENNHKMTDLVSEVSKNIAQNTITMESHTKALEKLVDKLS